MVLFWRLHSKTFPRLKDVASNGYGNNNSDRLMDKLRENDDQELSLINARTVKRDYDGWKGGAGMDLPFEQLPIGKETPAII